MVRYHGAGHAVLMWNRGLEVDRVFVDRIHLSGHVLPTLERPKNHSVSRRIARILYYLAGGVAHRCFQEGADKAKLHFSVPDLKYVLNEIGTLGDLPQGAEVYLLRALLARTIQIVDIPEVQVQIRALATALRPHGCLLKRQVHLLLKGLPVTRAATQKCRQVVAEIVAELPTLLQKAAEVAAHIAAQQSYKELVAIHRD